MKLRFWKKVKSPSEINEDLLPHLKNIQKFTALKMLRRKCNEKDWENYYLSWVCTPEFEKIFSEWIKRVKDKNLTEMMDNEKDHPTLREYRKEHRKSEEGKNLFYDHLWEGIKSTTAGKAL